MRTKSHLCRTMSSILIMLMTVVFVFAPTCASAQDDYRYSNCSASFLCGNLADIGYPFYGGDRPSYCGYPGFELTNCSSQYPVINITGLAYQVLEIFYETRTLTVARTDYLQDVCPFAFCNTTLNHTLFDFSSDSENITIYFGCPQIPNFGFTTQITCNINTNGITGYYLTPSMATNLNAINLLNPCSDRMYVPANQSNIGSLDSSPTQENLVSTLNQGFGLQWKAEDNFCETCRTTGGQCGYNDTTTSFVCFCHNRNDPFVCSSLTGQSGTVALLEIERSGFISFKLAPGPSTIAPTPNVQARTPRPGPRASTGARTPMAGPRASTGARTPRAAPMPSTGVVVQPRTPSAAPRAEVHPTSLRHSGTGKKSQRKLAIIIGLSISGAIAVGVGAGCYYLHANTKTIGRKKQNHKQIEEIIRTNDSLIPKRCSYSEIKKMTNSFKEKLGEGGFGSVYKGKLQNGDVVAVKFLSKSNGDGADFINEVASFSRTSHVNVVRLLGFCYEGSKRALIYEYMSNGSLDKFIYDQRSSPHEDHLKWDKLYEIAIGIARGLEYLHRGCATRIVHFDIKPHNILLDEDFCPKISDFGLAKLSRTRESRVSMLDARGTIGYIAPEVIYRNFGEVSYRADVYSYGMMVLEIIGARKNINVGASETYFPDWIYEHIESAGISRLHEIVAGANAEDINDEERINKMMIVGLWCIQMYPSDRPSMTKVVEMLEGSLESLQVPPKLVACSSVVRLSSPHSSTTASQITAIIPLQREENNSRLKFEV